MWKPSSEGLVKTWAHIREGWPIEEIALFVPGTASGAFDSFIEVIVGESELIRQTKMMTY